MSAMKIKHLAILSLLICASPCFFNCQSNTENVLVHSPSRVSLEQSIPNNSKLTKEQENKKAVTCTKKELVEVWREIQVDKDVKEQIMDADIGGDCSDYIKIAKKIDLNGDGIEELFVEGKGTFGSVSTIPIWVMQRKQKLFKILLREQGEIYFVRKTKTNGYRNLFFPSRRSIASAFHRSYKFEGGIYIENKCQIEFVNAPRHIHKTCNCNDENCIDKVELLY